MCLDIAAVMPCQIEICVVGHVDQGFPVTCHVVIDPESVVIGDCVCHLDFSVSGKSHSPVLVIDRKHDTVILYFRVPYSLVIPLVSVAVEVVGAVVHRKLVLYTVDGKACIVDAVCARSDRCPEEAAVFEIALHAVKSEHDIRCLPCLVRHEESDEDRAKVGHFRGNTVVVLDGVQVYFCTVLCFPKAFCCDCHLFSLFSFHFFILYLHVPRYSTSCS